MKKVFLFLALFVSLLTVDTAQAVGQVNLIIFERGDCQHCIDENAFLDTLDTTTFNIIRKDVKQEVEGAEFEQIAKKYGLPIATPITLIGNSIIAGFDTTETTGQDIIDKLQVAQDGEHFGFTIEHYINSGSELSIEDTGSSCAASGGDCEIPNPADTIEVSTRENFSFLGYDINIKNMGLFSIAAVLGTIDGFNPCAMWVLLTFLVALSQVGSRKKMAQIAGLFIVAEGIMYFLILNVWYQTWDFIKLDSIVTPAIGVFSFGAGLYFLHKWYKTKDNLTCDVTSVEYQGKIASKIQDMAKKPMTIAVVFGVLAIAFSVNIIEFACSIGIAQTFTKVLEINNLDFLAQQFYMIVYTFGYMIDDFIVFGLALWGYKSFANVGAKYSKHSVLIAGVLMILLGVFLTFFKDFLIL